MKKLLLILLLFLLNNSRADLRINEFLASNDTTIRDPDYNDFSDWVELANKSNNPMNIGGYYITDDLDDTTKWQIPAGTTLQANGYLVIWCDGQNNGLHSNFKLDNDGEEIGIFTPDGVMIDSVQFSEQWTDISYGRDPDNPDEWIFFPEPTLASANTTRGYNGKAPEPEFDTTTSFSSVPIRLRLSAPLTGASIRYTMNGSMPDKESMSFSDFIVLDSTTVVKAKTFHPDYFSSREVIRTFFIDFSTHLPVVSLSAPSAHFFGADSGLYVNDDQDIEHPIYLEYYDQNKNPGFEQTLGARIHGFSSASFSCKSFALYARDQYGDDRIDYPLFEDKDINEFKNFILRNAGGDKSYITDALVYYMARDNMDLDGQAYQPVVVFINGQFWGLYNMREKVNKYYVSQNYDIDPDEIDMIRYLKGVGITVEEGDMEAFNQLTLFVENNDLAADVNYQTVNEMVDIREFINYQILQSFIMNLDWPHNNYRLWRPKTLAGQWRWIVNDMDAGFEWAEGNGIEYLLTQAPNILLDDFMNNRDFKNEFIGRYVIHLNHTFQPDRIIRFIDSFRNNIYDMMFVHLQRWAEDETFGIKWPVSTMPQWETAIENLHQFAGKRSKLVREQLESYFNLEPIDLTFSVSKPKRGTLYLYDVALTDSQHTGTFYKGLSIPMHAVAEPGYRFSGWSVSNLPDTSSVIVNCEQERTYTAFFEPLDNAFAKVIVNEILYNPLDTLGSEDWVELYNAGSKTADISDWILKDENDDNLFNIPDGTDLKAGEFLVICRDTSAFRNKYPQVTTFRVGNFDFGFGSNDQVRLYSFAGNLVDSVNYEAISPWPTLADSGGISLQLLSTELDNSLAENWGTFAEFGSTPGTQNQFTTRVSLRKEKNPENWHLYPNYPNPFNGRTTISYQLPADDHIEIKIYDVIGREIRTLVNEYKSAGLYHISWDGRNDAGRNVTSGVYLISFYSEKYTQYHKLLMLK